MTNPKHSKRPSTLDEYSGIVPTEVVVAEVTAQLQRSKTKPQTDESSRHVLYCRISNDKAGEARGVVNQVVHAHIEAKRHRYTFLPDVETGALAWFDNDLSASRYARRVRPTYERLTKALRAGLVDVVHVAAWDRLFRRTADLERWRDIAAKHPFRIVVDNGTPVDLDNGDTYFNVSVLVAAAAKASDDTSWRIRRANEAKVRAGLPANGKVAMGLQYVRAAESDSVQLDPKLAPLVLAAAVGIVRGDRSLSSVAADWEREGVPHSRNAKRWTAIHVKRVLSSPSLVGDLVHRGEVVQRGAWQPVIDRVTWKALQRRFDRHVRYETPRRFEALSGLYRCGACGGHAMHKDRAVWRCARTAGGCGLLTIQREGADRVLLAHVFDQYNRHVAKRPATKRGDDRLAAALADLDAVQARLDEVDSDYAEGLVSGAERRTLRARLVPKLEAAESNLARVHAERFSVERYDRPIAEVYDAMTKHERRTLVAAFVSRVTVLPAGDARGRNVWTDEQLAERLVIEDGPLLTNVA